MALAHSGGGYVMIKTVAAARHHDEMSGAFFVYGDIH
jgi:hypothetical protein